MRTIFCRISTGRLLAVLACATLVFFAAGGSFLFACAPTSSPIAERPYCRECGTSFGFKFKEGSDKMDLTIASFDDPSRFKPKHHFGAESLHRAWLNTEGLPEIRTEDYPVLVDKWVEATGKFPG